MSNKTIKHTHKMTTSNNTITANQIKFLIEATMVIKKVDNSEAVKIVTEYVRENNWSITL